MTKDLCANCKKPYKEHYKVLGSQQRESYRGYMCEESVTILICSNSTWEQSYENEDD